MNCHQCRKEHKFVGERLILLAPEGRMLFCDFVCLRAWMRMPPPLTEGIPDPRSGGLSPQHVVVPASDLFRYEGESVADWNKRIQLLGVLVSRRDR